MSKSQWEMARPNEAKMYDVMDCGVDYEQLAKDLLGWMSDDEVGDFARQNGYFDELDEEEDEEEEEKDANWHIQFDEYETSNNYSKIKIEQIVFEDVKYQIGDTFTVKLVDEEFPELIYTCKVTSVDDKYVYCDME